MYCRGSNNNNGVLLLTNSQIDKPLNELKLSSVVLIKVCPPEVDRHLFCFEIHFSDKKGSPWKLGAFTQVAIAKKGVHNIIDFMHIMLFYVGRTSLMDGSNQGM